MHVRARLQRRERAAAVRPRLAPLAFVSVCVLSVHNRPRNDLVLMVYTPQTHTHTTRAPLSTLTPACDPVGRARSSRAVAARRRPSDRDTVVPNVRNGRAGSSHTTDTRRHAHYTAAGGRAPTPAASRRPRDRPSAPCLRHVRRVAPPPPPAPPLPAPPPPPHDAEYLFIVPTVFSI